MNKLRTKGVEAFFEKRVGEKSGTVLTKDVLEKAHDLMDQGYTRRDVSEEFGVKYDTLRKAINTGRLREAKEDVAATTKSARSVDTP